MSVLLRRYRSNRIRQAIRRSNRIRNAANQAHGARVQEPHTNATLNATQENIATAATFEEAMGQLNAEAIARDEDRATIQEVQSLATGRIRQGRQITIVHLMPDLKRANRAADERVQTVLQSVSGNSQAYASNTELIDLMKEARDEARTGRIYAENTLRETQLFR